MKTAIILPILFVFNSLYTLQVDKCICHLALIPKDVQDIIASYLIFEDKETDAELVERALETAQLPPALSLCEPFLRFRELSPDSTEIASYLIDRSKILLHEDFSIGYRHSRVSEVAIVDLKHKTITPNAQLTELCNKKTQWQKINSMVLSKDGILVARELQTPHPKLAGDLTEIIVKNMKSGDEQLIVKKWDLAITWYEFNKQATKILILSREIHQNTLRLTDTLYSLTSEKEHADKSKKTLAAYFRQNRVCKDLANSSNV